MSDKKNILLRGHGKLHADIKKYLSSDISVKVWMDKGKYVKRTGAEITHDLDTFYRQLKIDRRTGGLTINYQYRKEFLSIYRKLTKHANTFLYIYSRKPILNGENNFMDMMDAFHIYIHFFIDLLKTNNIHYVFFSTVPHHADYVLYRVAKELNIKTIGFFQSQEPGKAFMSTDFNQVGSLANCPENIQPIPIKRKARKSYFYLQNSSKYRPFIKVISALLFRRDMDLFFHRVMNLRKERRFKHNYNHLIASQLPKKKFVYFPLHLQPELSTMTWGGEFVDQMLAIECLRALLPDEWWIAVKEHPMQTAYARGPLFFARLAKLPNVVYIEKTVDTFELIENSEFCATVTGTVGLEALAFGKRALIFGQAVYKDFPGVIQYRKGLTFDDIMLSSFSHNELELAYAKQIHNMVDVVIDPRYVHLVENFSVDENTQQLANIINQVVRE